MSMHARLPLPSVPLATRILACAAALVLSGAAPSAAQDGPQKNILALYSGRSDMPANVVVEPIVRGRLTREFGVGLNLFTEYLDTTRMPEEGSRLAMRDHVRRRYAGQRFDLILGIATNAVDFLRAYGNELFPDTPVVSYGGRDVLARWGNSLPITGMLERVDISGTVELLHKLQPDVRRVVVISGVSRTDKLMEASARRQLRSFAGRVDIVFLGGMSLEATQAEVARLGNDSAVLFLAMSEDGGGKHLLGPEVVEALAETSTVPIYAQTATLLGHGIVGGVLFHPEVMAHEAADLVVRVLRGERVEDIAPRETNATFATVDWRQLRKWGISDSRLPPSTIVRYREPTSWQRYRWIVGIVVALFAVQSVLLASLLVQQARRRRIEQDLRSNESALRASHREVQRLAGKLIAAQESERARIARELHDDLSQKLALLSIDLDRLMEHAGAGAAKQMQDVVKRAREIATDVHELSHDLHPSKLETLGVVSAVQGLCRELAVQHEMTIEFAHENVPRHIPSDPAVCVFRIAQEALHNVVKHSRSARADVRLWHADGMLQLLVADAGRGFLPGSKSDDGLGLVSMRERVHFLGGDVTIHSLPGVGTRIRVRVPLDVQQHVAERAKSA
jgi:signal transduction histidine kinase